MSAAAVAECYNCGNPTWNGKWGSKCRKSCTGPNGVHLCYTGCGKEALRNEPGQKCTESCKGIGGARCVVHGCENSSWNGREGEMCKRSCKGPAQSSNGITTDEPAAAAKTEKTAAEKRPVLCMMGCGKYAVDGKSKCNPNCEGPIF
eukprot:TRINITY_DN6888_c0_g1_i1.p1 TRINITY_DN6888_c0_g1~~TRINITY_DN6888_c0_g1_i1.p1  ORF type:complete len:147 (-),score=16.31 TRINITY_DN6888_c0_g1_i1:168-608(-)